MNELQSLITQSITPADRSQWLDLRRNHITASVVAGLFPALNPTLPEWYPRFYALWAHHAKDAHLSEDDDNELAELGLMMEPIVMKKCAALKDWQCQPVDDYIFCPSERMGASLDAEIIDHEKGPGVLELKIVRYLTFRDSWTGEEPPFQYILQLHHQMMLTGRKWGAIAAQIGLEDFRVWEYDRDEAICDKILKRCRMFWRMVDENIEPEIDDHATTTNALKLIYKQDDGGFFDISKDDTARKRLHALHQARLDRKAADAAEQAQINHMMRTIGHAQTIVMDDEIVATAKTAKNGIRPLRILEKPKPFNPENFDQKDVA